jgi:hypothetical protein
MHSWILYLLIVLGCVFQGASSNPLRQQSPRRQALIRRQQSSVIEMPKALNNKTELMQSPSPSTSSGSTLTQEEQDLILNEMRLNPNATLWTVFRKDITRKWHLWTKHPSIALMV